MNDKKTLADWAFDFKVRLLDEKYYDDKNLYTAKEYEKIVPRDIEVSLFGEPYTYDTNELVIYQDNKLVITQDVVEKIRQLEKVKLELDLLEKELKETARQKMEEYNVTKIIGEGLAITYKAGYVRSSIDTKALEEELGEDFLEKFKKETKVSSSVSISVA